MTYYSFSSGITVLCAVFSPADFPADLLMLATLHSPVLTLFDVNGKVLYELWIQPQVLLMVWFQSSLLCVLVGLFSLLHLQLTTSRFGCVRLQTPQRTLGADQICDLN